MTTMQRLIQAFEECDLPEGDQLPVKWELCPACNGKGTMTLKRIAISADAFHEDPDFAEAYWRGDYDEPCDECNGRSTIQVVDEDALDPEVKAAWLAWLESDAETEAIYAMERRMGA